MFSFESSLEYFKNSCFDLSNSACEKENLLEPLFYRKLKKYEADFFIDIDLTAAVSTRFSKDYIIFHSRNYKKNNCKTNNFTVKFNNNGDLAFAFVDYYFKINDVIYDCVSELIICEQIFFMIL